MLIIEHVFGKENQHVVYILVQHCSVCHKRKDGEKTRRFSLTLSLACVGEKNVAIILCV